MAELDARAHDRITLLASRGDALADAGDFRAAIQEYNQAWTLVPEPKWEWNASTWLLAAIADAAYQGGFLQSAREALDYVVHCPDAIGNPFLHLRRGQVLLEMKEDAAAADELLRAYMGGGPEIFADEPPRFIEFLRAHAEI